MDLKTPILFLIYNRPEETQQVFESIRKAKPAQLFIAADGPRINATEDEVCKRVREIATNVDWNCEVKTLFQNENLGCGKAVSKAITWFFDNVEEGIILEDDIIPDPSFFTFSEEMLKKYRHDNRIMHISGCYFLDFLSENSSDSYYFSKHIHVWGWASWRRAWQQYDYNLQNWPTDCRTKKLKSYYGEYSFFWKNIYTDTYYKKIDTWDYQWMFAIYLNNGLAINPSKNLTKNIGYGDNATHTKDSNSIYTKIELSTLSKISHPTKIIVKENEDVLYYKHFLSCTPFKTNRYKSIIFKLNGLLEKLQNRKYYKFQLNRAISILNILYKHS